MKVLHIIETLGRAGAEQVLVNLLPELNARGVHSEVAVLWPPYDLQSALEARGVRVHRLNFRYAQRWNLAAGAERVRRLARRGGYDILHSHLLFANFYTATARPLPRSTRRVVTLHNTDFDFFAHSAFGQLAKRILPAMLRRGFAARTTVSRPVKAHFEQFVPDLDFRWIPNSFSVELAPDPQLDRAQIRHSLGVPVDAPLLVTVARLAPEKGHQYLFEALQVLAARNVHPYLVLLGDGPRRAELVALALELGVQERIIFAGVLPHDAMLPLVQSADLFVLPSLQEGFGLAPAEAMLLERPTIATNAGGLTDLIVDQQSGVLVPPADSAALVVAIAELLRETSLRARLGQAGRQRIIEQFAAPKIAAQWEEFYRELL